MRINEDGDGWVVIGSEPGSRQLAFQRGVTRVPTGRDTGFRVFVDPVGHPFCIVFGRTSSGPPG